MEDEPRLLAAWRGGDRAAGRVLFDRYFAALRRFFRGKVGELGDDLAQSTLLRCLQSDDELRSDGSFRAYLFAIAKNELYAHFRRAAVRGTPIDTEITCVNDLVESPSHVVAERSERRILLEALRRIPLDAQVLLELTYWEQLTSKELGAVLGVPETTVRSRLGKARTLLQVELGKLVGDGPLGTTSDDIDAWVKRIHDVAHEDED